MTCLLFDVTLPVSREDANRSRWGGAFDQRLHVDRSALTSIDNNLAFITTSLQHPIAVQQQ